ncbi:MAG: helix-turn-helix transcriptional regulator [Gelidibacter sp.]|nr:helix-turn-helix transcriptional regulator [Gelidibacter sp.]
METKLLNDLIKNSGLTQVEISEITGIPQGQLSRWVTGKRIPKLSSISEIANKIGYTINVSVEAMKHTKCQ